MKHTFLLSACMAALLSACGGGGGDSPASTSVSAAAPLATGITTLALQSDTLPDADALVVAKPAFHVAPVLLDEPDDRDAHDHAASARRGPRVQQVPEGQQALGTARLTVQALQGVRRSQALSAPRASADGASNDGTATPLAGSTAVSTYSPAQIRAAYGLPPLPAAGTTPTATQAAQLGAGQTIYIVNANHNPNVVAELAAFNQKFGLPGCTTKAIAPTASLPLPAPAAAACELSVVYSTTAGGMTSTAPAYEAGWATEIALDVQWAHATAPLARIVLIEAPDASLNNLLAAVRLANAMGPGVVSMSFGANEGSYTASVDSAFTGTGMTYLAATGDSGAAVSWPSVSPKVLAVGGTSLTYTGSGSRQEVVWSGTGGGMSAYTAVPAYQTAAVPGLGTVARRNVADVAFNANPSTGQYVAVMQPGSSTVNWISAGGTSLSTPQWAGVIVAANAMRKQAGKAVIGAAHATLYGPVATVPGTYASAFADVTSGSHGTCTICYARVGYDPATGLGTPNVSSLLGTLAGSASTAPAPVVTPASITGKVGTPLTFTVSASGSNALTYGLTGAPGGMVIGSNGAVSWPAPVVGTYAVTVVAKDSVTGLSGQGVYSIKIEAPLPPVVTSTTVNGRVGSALAFSVAATSANAVSYSLSGAPAGMTIGTSNGAVSWATPVAGTYAVTVNAKDNVTGLSGKGVVTVVISPALAPSVASTTITGKPGVALSFSASVTASNPVTYSLAGAPAGMGIGSTGLISWASPVLGTYAVTVIAKDSKTGLTGQGVITVKIAATGPTITAAAIKGVAGKPVSGSIAISAPGATALSVSISGVPMGMTFSASGLTLTASWAKPVAGSYNLKVVVMDSTGQSATANVPVTITAQ
ncbi:MAG: peptidase S53 [Aquincola sp.]|nr:peptidase S53 [Aquincola sp.]